jgi:hypothetical protein
MSRRVLSEEQTAHFIERGYVVLHDCFSRDWAQELTDKAFIRLGYDRNDPATWAGPGRIHMPTIELFDIKDVAPLAWQAACELVGGEERVRQPYHWSDAFIVNFHEGIDQPWQGPSAQSKGWHKDGDFFRHFLDSPEQGLLTLVLWSDIEPRGGGTFVATDSVPVVAQRLAEHPEGLLPGELNCREMINQCHDFLEMTGRCGDVVLLHPFILHTSSQNHLGIPRFLTNPPIALNEPMNFQRANPADFSPVERAVLHGLGVEKLDFQPAAQRERFVPERAKRQQKVLLEEKARLEAARLNG